MIMTYIKIVAAVFMLAQPAHRASERVPVSYAVATARSPEMSSKPASGSTKAAAHRPSTARADESKPAVNARVEKQVKPKSSDAPRARNDSPPALIAEVQPVAKAAVDTGTSRAYNAIPPLPNAAAADSNSNSNSDTKTTQQQAMAAMTVAELTTFTAREPDQKTTNTDHLVAILMARPDIKSVSDLAGKKVAIDGRQFSGNVRTAIVAAGATAVQLSEDQTKAIDRLIGGEVPAAVLTLVSPEASDGFPEIQGYRIFRIPLSPL
jgi:hypothetical protein